MPYKDFFCQKFKKCNQISITFCYVVKGMLKLLCGWFMNWLHLLPYFLPHKLSVATKNIRRGKVLLVKQQVKGSYPHGVELLFILGTSLSIGWKPQLGNWAKISCKECHWPISMVRFVKLMVKLALNACQLGNKIDTYNDTFCWLLFQINRTISHSCLGPAWYCCQPIRTRSQASDMMKWYQYVTWPCKACLYLGKELSVVAVSRSTSMLGRYLYLCCFTLTNSYNKTHILLHSFQACRCCGSNNFWFLD